MSDVLDIQGLSKHYGSIKAVDGMRLHVESGQVFGILGPNGSGKTTTLGMVLGVIRPTSGDFEWFGGRYGEEHRTQIGSILEKPNFYPNMSAYKNLRIAAMIKGASQNRVEECVERVGLAPRMHDSFKTYSLGMKQRLAIAAALLGDPEVLVLDEPTNGLDPQGIIDIRALIIDIAQQDKTILLASHLLDEVQKVCTDFAVLRSGKPIYQGKVAGSFGEEVRLSLSHPDIDGLIQLLEEHSSVERIERQGDRLLVSGNHGLEASELNRYLAAQGVYLSGLETLVKNLEEQFLEILKDNA